MPDPQMSEPQAVTETPATESKAEPKSESESEFERKFPWTRSIASPAKAPADILHVYTPDRLAARCDELGACEYIVEDFVPKQSLGITVGDSGVGKTAFIYQMAMCIAAGIPFLRKQVKQGRVLYMDYENGLEQVRDMLNRLARHLDLPAPPANLHCWNRNDCDQLWGENGHGLADVVRVVAPDLVIIDTFSSQFPQAEEKNGTANTCFLTLRKLMNKHKTSFLLVHHLRKPSEEHGAVSLEDADLRTYFNNVRGASSLINGCDIRLAVDAPGGASFVSGNQEVALVLRGYGRVSGEFPTVRLGRVHDDEGNPLGYRLLSGVALLVNPDHKAAFERLPPTFRFKDAKLIYGKAPQPTTDFLKKCMAAGILRKKPNGYEKIERVHEDEGSGQAGLAA